MRWADAADLPPVLTSEQVAEILGVGVDHVWAMAREGTAPIEPLRLGRSLRWPTAPLLQLLGIQPERESTGVADAPVDSNFLTLASPEADRRATG